MSSWTRFAGWQPSKVYKVIDRFSEGCDLTDNRRKRIPDLKGNVIDYTAATIGHLKIVPEGEAKLTLAEDYVAMLADEVMVGDALAFDLLIDACADLEAQANRAAVQQR